MDLDLYALLPAERPAGAKRIMDAFNPHLQAMQSSRVCYLAGKPGVGKSTLARLLAGIFERRFGERSVVWLTQPHIDLRGGSLQPGDLPGLPVAHLMPQRMIAERIQRYELRLVVLDGLSQAAFATEMGAYLSDWLAWDSGAVILLTVDALPDASFNSQNYFEVPELLPGEAAMLVMDALRRRGFNHTLPLDIHERLYAAVGGLPLALKLLAGLIGRLSPNEIVALPPGLRAAPPAALYAACLKRPMDLLTDDGRALMTALAHGDPAGEELANLRKLIRLSPHAMDAALTAAYRLALVEGDGARWWLHEQVRAYVLGHQTPNQAR